MGKMRIGILTFHRSHNYGAYLQAFALAKSIELEIGGEIEIIDFNMKTADRLYKKTVIKKNNILSLVHNLKRYKMFQESLRMLPLSNLTMISDSCDQFIDMVKDRYDIIVVGSDEVWKLKRVRGFPNPYWLPGNLGCKKVSYAASSRSNFDKLSDEGKILLYKYINDFDYIGVRDKPTYTSVSRYVENNNKLNLNCDPTFNFDFNSNKENGKSILIKRFKVDINKKVIGIMSTDPTLYTEIRKTYGDRFEFVSLYNKIPYTKSVADLTPFDWVDVIAALDFLVTTYFHGMCFAMKSNVPFVLVECRTIDSKSLSKSYDLLSRVGLDNHFCMRNDEDIFKVLNKQINDYLIDESLVPQYDYIINEQRELSKSFFNRLRQMIKER